MCYKDHTVKCISLTLHLYIAVVQCMATHDWWHIAVPFVLALCKHTPAHALQHNAHIGTICVLCVGDYTKFSSARDKPLYVLYIN